MTAGPPSEPGWLALRFDFTAMASPCALLLEGQDEDVLRSAADAAIGEVRRIEARYSRYRDDSVLAAIHRSAGRGGCAVDDETAALLDYADALWKLSGGLFDITSGVLRRAWDFRAGRLPQPDALAQALALVGWGRVRWQRPWINLPETGMELDFGGFGKEYAVDRAAAVLLARGIQHALVELGGDVHAIGPRGLPQAGTAHWQIGIRDPRPQGPADTTFASLPLQRGAIATSGDYERFFDLDGQRYCHILRPDTGWPVTHWRSISVLAANASTAGALSTIGMLMEERALAWLADQDARYLAVDRQGTVHRR